MIRTVIVVVLALLGIFVHPFAPGTLDFIYRFIVFAVLTYLVYINWRSSEEEIVETSAPKPPVTKPVRKELPLEVESTLDFAGLLQHDERIEQFLLAQFHIIQNVLIAENGWVFYKANSETIRKIHFEKFSGSELTAEKEEYPLSGLIKILDEDDKILIENNLKEKQGLFSYYSGQPYNPASFLGFPIDIHDGMRVMMVFDSQSENHFNPDDRPTLNLMRHNTKTFILNRMKAYELLKDLKEKDKMLRFAVLLNGCKTVSVALSKLAEVVSQEYEATRLTVCTNKADSDRAVIRKIIGQKDDYDENFEFELDQGLAGWVIDKNKPYLIDDMEKGEYFIPRYTKEEKTNFGLRSFLGIPINADDKVFGALTLEHTSPGKYTEQDLKNMTQLVSIFSTTFLRQHS